MTYHLDCNPEYGLLGEAVTGALFNQFVQIWPESQHQYFCLRIALHFRYNLRESLQDLTLVFKNVLILGKFVE